MIFLDSSGWIEIFLNGSMAPKFQAELERHTTWISSSINLFEVYRKIARTSVHSALEAVTFIRKGMVILPSEEICLAAADININSGLGMADSIILATARSQNVKLYTKDHDFKSFPDCIVLSS
jgi:predicted nucleic acid-binding protein